MLKLLDLTPAEQEQALIPYLDKPYKIKQLQDWIYKKFICNFTEMSNLARSLQEKLESAFSLALPTILEKKVSDDGTAKYLLKLHDELQIEMVHIPLEEKNTLCISSQVGCSRNCQFCATAALGLKRNLNVDEIIGQIILASKDIFPQKITNVVFMGMGEPLDNYENLIKSLSIIQNEKGLSFSPRRITISTCGIIPKIKQLCDSGYKVKLAVSLNSAIPQKRSSIMPVNKLYPLHDLKKALLEFRKKTAYRVTFEYIMIKDFNMGEEDLKALSKYVGDISCKLNLIKWHKIANLPFSPPSDFEIEIFREKLNKLKVAVTLRKSRGEDIYAACGLLAARS